MKRSAMLIVAGVIGFLFIIFSGHAADQKYSGFLGDYYGRLGPGPKDGVKERWLKPGVDFKKYKRFMVDSIVFYLADDSENKGIDPQEMKELGDACNKAIVDALKDNYPIVADPAPDVARLRFAITRLQQSKPAASAVSSLLPVGVGISLLRKGTTGSWSGAGATAAELMVLDSMTNDVIAVAVDERTAGYSERFTKWGSAVDAFKYWGMRLFKFIYTHQ